MDGLLRLSRYLMGFAVIALGLQSLLLKIYVGRLEPIPAWVPGHDVIALVTGAFLLAVGVLIVIQKFGRTAAALLAIVLFVWVLLLYVPLLIVRQPVAWLGTFETFACACGAWMLAALTRPEHVPCMWNPFLERSMPLARYGFGISLPVFGLAHFIYPEFVASWIPTWLPAPPLFWAYFTGVAHVAAGVGILAASITPTLARTAALLAALMYASWVLIIHIPRTHAALHDAFEWNGIFVATMLSASALLAAISITAPSRRSPA